MKILIRDAQILNTGSKYHGKKTNLLIENGKITYLGKEKPSVDREIAGKDLKVSTGWVDMFSLLCDPGYEHKEDIHTGTEAAASGGFTSIVTYPNSNPPIQTKNDISYLTSGNGTRLVQVLPVASVTIDNKGEDLTEMIDLHEAGAIAFSDGTVPIWHTDIVLKSLQYLQKFDGLLINKPEDKRLNLFGVMNEGKESTILGMKGMPRLAEEIAVSRDLRLLEYAGGRLHIANISTPGAIELIRKAKKMGLNVTCDVAAHQLVLDDSMLSDFDSNYKVNPPLRENGDIRALIKGVHDGTIDAIVSSHQPQDEESKNLEFDLAEFGIIGFQTVLPYLVNISDSIEWKVLVEKLTDNPRSILKMDPPTIQVDEIADLTVFDVAEDWTFDHSSNKSRSKNSPLFGKQLKGRVKAVFKNKKHKIF
jgi:dihydroorotase